MLDDDFRIRIQSLELTDELDAFSCIALRIFRISEDNGKLRNDPKAAYSRSQGEGVLGTEIFIHFLQIFVRTRFGSEEDHGAPGPADSFERGVRILHHDVGAAFTPPSHFERGHPVYEFTRVLFS